ncbi:MAG: 5'/3'-nucleotidase SurE [Syntrophorhabdaceae bacterium]|nr:5'/3'-nucleotidase SurE [Syntrophorhabdaceae bacterium]
MLILLSNDDGIHSEGLTTLKETLEKYHDVIAVAPEKERTCISHAVTIHKPLRIKKINDNTYCTNGTPADCICLALNKILPKKPDLIISGINKGPNMGQDVHYSGTVAAAKEGALMGIPSMAVSISAREHFYFKDAGEVVMRLLGLLGNTLQKTFKDVFLNVNIPNLPYDKIKGFLVTRLGKRVYNDIVTERIDPRGNKYYWIGGNGDTYEKLDGSDFIAVENGYVSITPITLDITNSDYIDVIKNFLRRFL